MILPIIHLMAVAWLAAILFLVIDKYERDYFVGNVLKLFVLTLASVVILRKLLLIFGGGF